jgi:hypothetical protein
MCAGRGRAIEGGVLFGGCARNASGVWGRPFHVFQKCHCSSDIARQCVFHYLGTAEGVALTHPLAVSGQGEVNCLWSLPQERT